MADSTATITIDGKTLSLDPEDLELGEVELLEETMDASMDEIDFARAKAMRVLVYILMHREDPQFTMDDAAHVKLSAFAQPAAAAANGDTPSSSKRPTKAAKSG